MEPKEKILKVLNKIKEKMDISPDDSVFNYRAGLEESGLKVNDEVMILNKLAEDGIIEVKGNFGSESQ